LIAAHCLPLEHNIGTRELAPSTPCLSKGVLLDSIRAAHLLQFVFSVMIDFSVIVASGDAAFHSPEGGCLHGSASSVNCPANGPASITATRVGVLREYKKRYCRHRDVYSRMTFYGLFRECPPCPV
jgi:hypothetical protein